MSIRDPLNQANFISNLGVAGIETPSDPLIAASQDIMAIQSVVGGRQKPPIVDILEKDAPAFFYVVKKESGDPKKPQGYIEALSNKFLLTNIQENHLEKLQVLETFGEPVLYFFNERTKIYSLAGLFLNAYQGDDKIIYNWALAFRSFYNDYLRGTKLAEAKNIAILAVDGMLMYGYAIAFNIVTDSQNPHSVPFTMSYMVTKQVIVPPPSIYVRMNADANVGVLTAAKKWKLGLEQHYKLNYENLTQAQEEQLQEVNVEIDTLTTEIEQIIEQLQQLATAGSTDFETLTTEKDKKGILRDNWILYRNNLVTSWYQMKARYGSSK